MSLMIINLLQDRSVTLLVFMVRNSVLGLAPEDVTAMEASLQLQVFGVWTPLTTK